MGFDNSIKLCLPRIVETAVCANHDKEGFGYNCTTKREWTVECRDLYVPPAARSAVAPKPGVKPPSVFSIRWR